jgi:hypothetical protein
MVKHKSMKMKLYHTFPVVLMSFLLPACKSDQVTPHAKHVILIGLDGMDHMVFSVLHGFQIYSHIIWGVKTLAIVYLVFIIFLEAIKSLLI